MFHPPSETVGVTRRLGRAAGSLASARRDWAERRFRPAVSSLCEAVLHGVIVLRLLPVPPGPLPQQVRLLQDLQCLREASDDPRGDRVRDVLFRGCARRVEGLLRRLQARVAREAAPEPAVLGS